MNARIEALQMTATGDIAPATQHWLQKLHAAEFPSDSTTVSKESLMKLLTHYRQELSGVFSRDELFILLNGLLHTHYEPNELHFLATDIFHDFGADIAEAEESGLWDFLTQLQALTLGQSVALVDALQLALVADEGPTECWKALGIELKDD
ncbi:hypothetical protein [Alicycliphilus denitrificans]|uniref:hypothetical protein n=1 Tax=Alicycliphilus denitrificans TaxID=179636 RepID=UPI000C9F1CB1|nr:hypothetical protein [Alicycliphilus denitrificans]